MAEIQSNYHAGSELCSDGINNITSTINGAVDQANCQCDSEIEKLTKTFVEGQPFHASDMNAFVDKLNEIIDALNGTTEQWEIADIVIYDNVEDTKIKSTADCFSLDKFPENRYTPIGIVTEVLEDGSAKIISLPEMSYKTPDVGTVEYEHENIIRGINNNLVDSKKVLPTYDNEEDLNIIGVSTDNLIYPSTDDESCMLLSKDNKRFYGKSRSYSVSGNYYGPSAFNEDGTYNDEFFRENIQFNLVLYAWMRVDDSSQVVYTNTETISENTIGFINKDGGSGFFISEGLENITVRLLSNSDSGLTTEIFQLPFNSNYTRAREYDLINPVLKSATSERDGKINTLKMLQHQSDLYFDKEYHHKISDREMEYGYSGMYTATMKLWFRYNESNGKNYYLFTTNISDAYYDESVNDDNDQIWIQHYNSRYFVPDYGCREHPTNAEWIYIGSVNDENVIRGGKQGFLSKFTRVTEDTTDTTYLYCWYRIKDGVYHFLYTSDDADNLNENTEIWINTIYTDGYEMSNFVTDYGLTWNEHYPDDKYHMYKAGTMSDESLIEGGVSGFLEKFTRCEKMIWMSDSPLLNIPIINHFPAESTSWRFHTPGTNQGDWYIPSVGELAVAMSNYHEIQNALKSLITAKVNVLVKTLSSGDYTTSTEQIDTNQKYLDSSTTIYYIDNRGGSGNYYGRYPFTVRVLEGEHSVRGLPAGSSGSYYGSSSYLRAFTKVRPLKNNS